VSIPVAFEVVRKPHPFSDVKTRKVKRASEVTKNGLMREMMAASVANAIKFRYVLTDSWFAAKESFDFILKKGKRFISALLCPVGTRTTAWWPSQEKTRKQDALCGSVSWNWRTDKRCAAG
jgi:hypothetical protein